MPASPSVLDVAARHPDPAPLGRAARLPVAHPGAGPLVVLALVAATPLGLALMLDGSTYDTWGAFLWGPVLLVLAFPLCRWVARRTGEPTVAGFLFAAATLKIVVGATLRYYMVDAVYGAGDSLGYDRAAAELAAPFRSGVFEGLGEVTGTRFVEILNGLVQAVIGETMVGSFLVFSAMAFVGMCLLYVAFCEALPGGDRVLYRRLLFLTPTVWFWPSSVGKEAFLMLGIGAVALGLARMLNGHARALPLAGLGLWGAAVVRPHIALMLLVGAVAAVLPLFRLGRRPTTDVHHPVARLLLPVVVLLALPASLGAAERFFGLEGLNLESAAAVRDEVTRRTSAGGSEFVAPDTDSPGGLVQGIGTVIARPFPWEATEFQAVAAAETAVLAGVLAVAAWRRRRTLVAGFGRRWTRLSIAYVLAFGWAFSAVSNFGILARQRSLMLPFLFVVVAATTRPAVAGRAGQVEIA